MTGRIKYALFAPLAAALLLVSNILTVACTATKEEKSASEEVKVELKQSSQQQSEENKQSEEDKQPVVTYNEEAQAYNVVEVMPEFPGGMKACMEFLSKNIKYPSIPHENGVQGRVIIQFVVDKDGSIVDPVVVRGVDSYLDAEALRVIKLMPKWKPGTLKGEAVRVKYTVPVTFKLQ